MPFGIGNRIKGSLRVAGAGKRAGEVPRLDAQLEILGLEKRLDQP